MLTGVVATSKANYAVYQCFHCVAVRGSGLIIHLNLAGVHCDHAIDRLFYDWLDNTILTFHSVPLTSDDSGVRAQQGRASIYMGGGDCCPQSQLVHRACGIHCQVGLSGNVVLSPWVCVQFRRSWRGLCPSDCLNDFVAEILSALHVDRFCEGEGLIASLVEEALVTILG